MFEVLREFCSKFIKMNSEFVKDFFALDKQHHKIQITRLSTYFFPTNYLKSPKQTALPSFDFYMDETEIISLRP